MTDTNLFRNNWLDINYKYSDQMLLVDEQAIQVALYNLFTTSPGERWFNPRLGNPLLTLLFENIVTGLPNLAKNRIAQYVARYDPRIIIQKITASSDVATQPLTVTVGFAWVTVQSLVRNSSIAMNFSQSSYNSNAA